MYGAMTNNGDLIAFHEEKNVIKKYINDYQDSNKETLIPFHIKKKKVKKYSHLYEDLYLIRYNGSYIQSKYMILKQIDVEPFLDDIQYAKDIIVRTIEFSNNKKDRNTLWEAYNILNEEMEKVKRSTPTLDELKRRYVDIEMYQHAVD